LQSGVGVPAGKAVIGFGGVGGCRRTGVMG
jgi:hypothetical protein